MLPLSVADCREDSPAFRQRLSEYDVLVDDLERRLKQLVAHAKKRCEFEEKERQMAMQLAKSLAEFADAQLAEEGDELFSETMHRFASAFMQLEDHRDMLIAQAKASFIEPLEEFLRDDIREHRDATRTYERACSDYDGAMDRFAACRANDFQSLLDTSNVLGEAKRNYHRTACEFVIRTNGFHARKKFLLAERVMDYTTSQLSFFRLGNSLFADVEGRMGDLFDGITGRRKSLDETLKSERENGRDSLAEIEEVKAKVQLHYQARAVQMPQIRFHQPPPQVPAPDADGVVKKGYLFVGTKSPFGMSWVRYYHTLTVDGRLSLQRRFKGALQIEWFPLRISTVKVGAEVDRNFVFQLISPAKTLLLQADSQEELDVWVISLQAAIATALNSNTDDSAHASPAPGSSPHASARGHHTHGHHHKKAHGKSEHAHAPHEGAVEALSATAASGAEGGDGAANGGRSAQGTQGAQGVVLPPLQLVRGSAVANKYCADCGADADWASINIGCTLCLECSGVHRSLGVHISQVRSLTLDRWREEWIEQMKSAGNAVVNEAYERTLPENTKPTPQATRKEREAFIRQKYVDLAFMAEEDRERILSERRRVQQEAQEAASQAAAKAAAEAAARAQAEAARLEAEAAERALRAAEGGLPTGPSPSAQAISSWFSGFGEGARSRNSSKGAEDDMHAPTLASSSSGSSLPPVPERGSAQLQPPAQGAQQGGLFSRMSKSLGNTYRSVVDFAKNDGEGQPGGGPSAPTSAPPEGTGEGSFMGFGRRK